MDTSEVSFVTCKKHIYNIICYNTGDQNMNNGHEDVIAYAKFCSVELSLKGQRKLSECKAMNVFCMRFEVLGVGKFT